MTRREQIVAFIASYWEKHGYAPSYREIGDGVGLASREGASRWVHLLRDEGVVTFVDGLARTVRVVK